MTDQLELLRGDLPPEWEGLRSLVTFGGVRGGKTHAGRVQALLDEYVAAISSERRCRCQGKTALARAEVLRDTGLVPLERNDEVEQLEDEGRSLLERARHHLARAQAIAARLISDGPNPIIPVSALQSVDGSRG